LIIILFYYIWLRRGKFLNVIVSALVMKSISILAIVKEVNLIPMIKRINVFGNWHRDRNNQLVKGKSFVRKLETSRCRNNRLDSYQRAVLTRVIYRLRRQGGTVHDIAQIYKLSTRTVAKMGRGKGVTDLRHRSVHPSNKFTTIVKIHETYHNLKDWFHAYTQYIETFEFDVDMIYRGEKPP
tara:strand:- start:13565 stop:14110 length:546 start_codon:yes stop_codon:yes gene_type:complete